MVYSFRSACTGECLSAGVDMYVLHTDKVNQSFARNVSVFEDLVPVSFRNPFLVGFAIVYNERISHSSTSGFYIAFRDLGSCIDLKEVVAFHHICDAISLDLGANFSTDHFPGDMAVGICFPNMAVDLLNNTYLEATCDLFMHIRFFTRWTISGNSSRCMCLPGHKFTSANTIDQCEGRVPLKLLI